MLKEREFSQCSMVLSVRLSTHRADCRVQERHTRVKIQDSMSARCHNQTDRHSSGAMRYRSYLSCPHAGWAGWVAARVTGLGPDRRAGTCRSCNDIKVESNNKYSTDDLQCSTYLPKAPGAPGVPGIPGIPKFQSRYLILNVYSKKQNEEARKRKKSSIQR